MNMKCVLAFLLVPGVGKTSDPSFWAWEVGSVGSDSPIGLSLPSGCSLCPTPGSKEQDGAGKQEEPEETRRGPGVSVSGWPWLFSFSPKAISAIWTPRRPTWGSTKPGCLCLTLLLECFKVSEGLIR